MPKVRNEYAHKYFYYNGAKVYNQLPLKIRKIADDAKYEKSLTDNFNQTKHSNQLKEPFANIFNCLLFTSLKN